MFSLQYHLSEGVVFEEKNTIVSNFALDFFLLKQTKILPPTIYAVSLFLTSEKQNNNNLLELAIFHVVLQLSSLPAVLSFHITSFCKVGTVLILVLAHKC